MTNKIDALVDALEAYLHAGFGNSTDFAKQGEAYDKAIEALALASGHTEQAELLVVTDEMVERAAKVFCKIRANQYEGLMFDYYYFWDVYANTFRRDARAVLEAAHNIELSK